MLGKWPLGKIPLATMPAGHALGALAVTEDDDSLSASAQLRIAGSAALVEQDDTLAAVGIFVVPRVGTVNVTEADDVLDARAVLPIFATAHLIEDDDAAEVRAIVRGAAFRYAKARYEAPPLMKARREPRTFRAQRLAA